MNFLLRRVGEQVGVMLLGFSDGASQRAGLVNGVGVREEQPLAPSFAGPGSDRIVFSCPTGGQRAGCDHSHIRKRLGDPAGTVGRTVVYDDDLKLDSNLREQGLEAGAQAGLLVPGGHDHRHGRPPRGW